MPNAEPPTERSPAGAPRNGAAVIQLSAVHLSLPSDAGQVRILKGVDLTIRQGETVGLVGPSGSGKTSLLMVLSGLERATSGSIDVADRRITGMSEDALADFRRENIGIVFQNFHLVPAMTALENVAVPLEFSGAGDPFGQAREGLEAVGLGHRLSHYPGQLSGGEQQRVALARAFAGRPGILLADEPTGNLDEETGAHVSELLFGLHDRHGTTLLLVTHQPGLAERCSRVLTIRDGLIAEDRAAGGA